MRQDSATSPSLSDLTETDLLYIGMRYHAGECSRLGSALYDVLLTAAAEDLDAGGVVAEVFADLDVSLHSVPSLRLMRAVHRLVLDGNAPQLAAYFPSVGGSEPAQGSWPAMSCALAENRDRVRELIALPLQTNDVGRSAALYGSLIRVAEAGPPQIRLLEPGCSAGLNLNADHYAYLCGDITLGDADSPVRFTQPWIGVPSTRWRELRPVIVERAGCDLQPLDPARREDQLRLLSSIWGDQPERVDRARAAFEVAAQQPIQLDCLGAGDWLEAQLSQFREGRTTVVWHSLFWQYLPEPERARIDDLLAIAGARATTSGPLVRLALEPDMRGGYAITLVRWPGARSEVIAHSEDHGLPTTWH